MPCETDDETVVPGIAVEVVHPTLTDIGLISSNNLGFAYGELQSCAKTQRRHIAGIREADIAVVVTERKDFVVRLSILWRKHKSCQWGLDGKPGGTVFPEEVESAVCHEGGPDIESCASLCRIIAVAGGIGSTGTQACQPPCT